MMGIQIYVVVIENLGIRKHGGCTRKHATWTCPCHARHARQEMRLATSLSPSLKLFIPVDGRLLNSIYIETIWHTISFITLKLKTFILCFNAYIFHIIRMLRF